MGSIVALSGGGIKAAVAAGTYIGDYSIVFVHVDYGQDSARAEKKAIRSLCQVIENTKPLFITLDYVKRLGNLNSSFLDLPLSHMGQNFELEPDEVFSPLLYRGLMTTIFDIGVQVSLRINAEKLITGISGYESNDPCMLALGGCRPESSREFLHLYQLMIQTLLPGNSNLEFECPLFHIHKEDILKLAERYHLPLKHTWTCIEAGPEPCGTCQQCVRRFESFALAGMTDPLSMISSTV